jgi:predicted MPP superfamily phosphohydrolase
MKLTKKIKYSVLGLLGLLSLLLAWGVAIEPYLIDREEEVALIPGLPASWQGKRVALIADFQVGMWMDNTPTIRRIVKQLVEERPAFILIAGDFVYKPDSDPTAEINEVVELVRPLSEAQIPTYAVLGNHDYAKESADDQRSSELQKALEAAGIQVLKNEAVALAPPTTSNNSDRSLSKVEGKQPLYLVGIGAHRPDEDRPIASLQQVPTDAPRLVLMHNPASFAKLPAATAPVAMAGHTHGGQIRIPFTPGWSWMSLIADKPDWSWISEIRGDEVRVSGWIKGYGQPENHLYINRGIGFSKVPIRLNCPPEITLFTLQRPEESTTHRNQNSLRLGLSRVAPKDVETT